jgi:hypothetical protein
MERSRNCPHCRGKVHRLSKNHIVNNLVDAYLKAHPEKKRSDDELREMDARNKITEDMVEIKLSQCMVIIKLSLCDSCIQSKNSMNQVLNIVMVKTVMKTVMKTVVVLVMIIPV